MRGALPEGDACRPWRWRPNRPPPTPRPTPPSRMLASPFGPPGIAASQQGAAAGEASVMDRGVQAWRAAGCSKGGPWCCRCSAYRMHQVAPQRCVGCLRTLSTSVRNCRSSPPPNTPPSASLSVVMAAAGRKGRGRSRTVVAAAVAPRSTGVQAAATARRSRT